MTIKQKIITAIVILLVFVLNSGQLVQQATYYNIYIPIAENLLSGNGYTCSVFNNQPAFYPLWGYTFLTALDQICGGTSLVLLLIQFVLAYYGIILFYKIFYIKFSYIHLFLFVPYFALMSVKWPDAIAGFLLILYVYYSIKSLSQTKIKYALLAGLTIGVLSNFRAEYLYLVFFNFLIILFNYFKGKRIYVLKHSFAILTIGFICMIPWSLRYYADNHEFSLGSSNGGAVMYVSLGQLSNNSWGIQPVDSVAIKYVNKFGLDNQYTPEADKLLTAECIRLIKQNPDEYAEKCFGNLLKSVAGGVYTGEYANLFIPIARRDEINKEMTSSKGLKNLQNLFSLKLNESLPLIFEKFIQFLFIVIFFILIFWAPDRYIIDKEKPFFAGFLIITVLVIYKLLLISLIQYEYRHMNSIYLLMLGTLLVNPPGFVKRFLHLNKEIK